MTVGIIPESDREKGGQSVSPGSQAANTMRLPQIENPSDESHPGGPPDPPFFREGRRPLSSPKKTAKIKNHRRCYPG